MTSLRRVTVPDPAVGTNFTYTQPTNLISLLLSFRMYLLDDANVPVRSPYLSVFESGGNLMSTLLWSSPVMGTASTGFFLCGQSVLGIGLSQLFAGERYYTRESPTIVLLPGWTLQSRIDGLQVGDQLSQIVLLLSDVGLTASGAIA